MIYVNIDLEATGPDPAKNAILSIGAVAHDSTTWKEISHFYQKLEIPEGREWDADTRRWWQDFPRALEEAQASPRDPWTVMHDFFGWIAGLKQTLVDQGNSPYITYVAYPVGFESGFLLSYISDYIPEELPKFALRFCDIQSLAMAALHVDFLHAQKSGWPSHWHDPDLPHTHVAIEDAREQAHAFIQIMRDIGYHPANRP